MSRKPDLPFIIFLVIVIAGGIYLLKLTKQRSGLRREKRTTVRDRRVSGADDF